MVCVCVSQQKLECNVEWPMCVPGLAVRVLPRDASTSVTCHLQVEWMYAHVSHCQAHNVCMCTEHANTRTTCSQLVVTLSFHCIII